MFSGEVPGVRPDRGIRAVHGGSVASEACHDAIGALLAAYVVGGLMVYAGNLRAVEPAWDRS